MEFLHLSKIGNVSVHYCRLNNGITQPYSLSTTGAVRRAPARHQMGEWVPKQNDLRNFLMSEECAEMAQTVAHLA